MTDDLSPEQAIKAPCRAATTANITLSGLQTIDGIALAAGDRVLVKSQASAAQNGIYEAASGGWARAADADDGDDIVGGTLVAVTTGTINGKSLFQVAGSGPRTPGTDPIELNLRPSPLTPEDFGAKGDGVTDDYDALQALAAAVTARGGGKVLFGRNKTYRIDRIRIWGGPSANGDTFIQWLDCRGLEIDLNGSKIDVKGDFNRASDGAGNSYWNSIVPFFIAGGSDIVLRNGEVDQNVDLMTRESNVAEGFSTPIMIAGCNRVLVENVHSHHGSTDGIMVTSDTRTAPFKVSRNVVLRNVVSRYNARLGLALIGCVGFVAENCDFSHTGKSAGTYGHHSPAGGVDVEPDYLEGTGSLNVDAKTRGICFHNCSFDDNAGFPFIASNPDSAADVTLLNCRARSSTATAIVFCVERFVIDGGDYFNVGVWPGYSFDETAVLKMSGRCTGARFRGSAANFQPFLCSYFAGPYFLFGDNKVSLEATEASPVIGAGSYQMLMQGQNLVVRDNDFFVAKELYAGTDSFNLLGNVARARLTANRWRTDLMDSGKLFLLNSNGDNSDMGVLAAERYVGRIGPFNAAPENYGTQTFAVGRIRPGIDARDVTYAAAAPTGGTWARGDVVLNNAPSASGKVGWVCTTGGSPGTWKPFGAIDA